jgi:hypothetical protein
MKKLILILVVLGFIMGCGQSAVQSGFYQHDSQFATWDHLKFSLFGYRNPTEEDVKKSKEQGWWGAEIPYVPGQ